jgi:hypothetical protein
MKKYTLDTLTGNIIEHSGFHPEENRSVSLSVVNSNYATVKKFSDIFFVSCFQDENEIIPDSVTIQDNIIKISFSEISSYSVVVNFYFEDPSFEVIQVSNTPSITPSISVTPTITPSVSVTPTISTSATPTITPSVSVTPTISTICISDTNNYTICISDTNNYTICISDTNN